MNRECLIVREKLIARGLDAMLVTDDISRRYVTEMPDSAGVCLIGLEKAFILTDFRYIEAANAFSADFGVDMVNRGRDYPAMVEKIVKELGIKKIGFEQGRMTVGEYSSWEKGLSAELIPAGELIDDLRVCKTEEELNSLIAGQRIAERAFEATLPHIKEGVTEAYLRNVLAAECYLKGAEDLAFDFIVAAGANSAKPHAVPGDRIIRAGDFVTFDFGAKINGYGSDMTRTVCVGEPTAEMRKIYDIVLRAQKLAADALKAGISYEEFDGVARRLITDEGYGPAFGHSLSHGIGLEIHEAAYHSDGNRLIPAGAVVSVEPGIYLEGRFGVRIEDMAFVTPGGSRNLTECPKDLLIL